MIHKEDKKKPTKVNSRGYSIKLSILGLAKTDKVAPWCKVFHQYTGDNFNNYLDEIRISEAKRLLAMDEYRVYEVAEMVGYSNINYFHNKFKKYVGMSPLSYKKQFGGGKDE